MWIYIYTDNPASFIVVKIKHLTEEWVTAREVGARHSVANDGQEHLYCTHPPTTATHFLCDKKIWQSKDILTTVRSDNDRVCRTLLELLNIIYIWKRWHCFPCLFFSWVCKRSDKKTGTGSLLLCNAFSTEHTSCGLRKCFSSKQKRLRFFFPRLFFSCTSTLNFNSTLNQS